MLVHIKGRITSPSQYFARFYFDDQGPCAFALTVLHRFLKTCFQGRLYIGIQCQIDIITVNGLRADIARSRKFGSVRRPLILHPSVFSGKIIFQSIFQSHLTDDALFLFIIAGKSDQMRSKRASRIIAIARFDEVDPRKVQIFDLLHFFLADPFGAGTELRLDLIAALGCFHRCQQCFGIHASAQNSRDFFRGIFHIHDISRLTVDLTFFIQICNDRISHFVLCDNFPVSIIDRSAFCRRCFRINIRAVQRLQNIRLAPDMLMRQHRKKDIRHYQCPC